ncbi:lysosome-associated membrane glycoprotein 5-like [Diadema setosum]|uniref:lysosome-associated membrane glycoprotein 5-like n=1 Tax=Diadema setosum TaxID=31175 RepID=UPI003B3BB982
MYLRLALLLLISAGVQCQAPSASEDNEESDIGQGDFGPPFLDPETGAVETAASSEAPQSVPEPLNYSIVTQATTIAPSHAEIANFTVRDGEGNACIRACFSAVLNIFYSNKESEEEEVTVPLPRKATATGSCGSAALPALLSIQWSEGKYNLKFTFENTTADGKESWKARKVQFTYNMSDPTYFKNPARAGVHTVRSESDDSFFKTPAKKSRKCDAESDIQLLGGSNNDTFKVLLELRNLQLQPYNVVDDSFSEAEVCKNDKTAEGTNMASIAVGATLALVILVVIAGYAIGRRMGAITDRTSYSSMD